MSQKKMPPNDNPLDGMEFDEALERQVRSSPGEVADALTRGLLEQMKKTRKQIQSAREDIERGARTKQNKDRFRL